MLAAVLNAFDGPDSITVSEIPDPQAGADELLLRVDAASVGPWDVQSTTGALTGVGGIATFPQTVGWDFCGTVLASGPGVSGWSPGERVLGFSPQPWSGIGVFAEQVALPVSMVARAPQGLDATAAATLPVASLTAALALREAAVAQGSRLLVIGAVGAVGGFLTQLAGREGVHVIASVSPSEAEQALKLGASAWVDRNGNVAQQCLDAGGAVDAIVDLVGPAAAAGAIAALRPDGRFVTSITGVQPPELPTGISPSVLGVQPDPDALSAIAERVAAGEILARVGAILPLSDVREAYRIAATAGGAKTVLKP
jgi:NADPH:quinone reductase-like Zn-dependent oxidoreductase